jgi:hypothetical protein
MKEKQDVTRAEETLAAEQQKLVDLQALIEADVSKVAADDDVSLQPLVLRPRKADVTVTTLTLAWKPGR